MDNPLYAIKLKMKEKLLILVNFIIVLFLATSVSALFGRVADFEAYHHVCFRLNNNVYNFIINHSGSNSWPCGNPDITKDYIRIECISKFDGAHLGKHVPCKGGTRRYILCKI